MASFGDFLRVPSAGFGATRTLILASWVPLNAQQFLWRLSMEVILCAEIITQQERTLRLLVV